MMKKIVPVGIGIGHVGETLGAIYGENSDNIGNIDDLPSKLLEILERIIPELIKSDYQKDI